MIGTLMSICLFGMFLVGVLFPLGILIYMTVIFIKEKDWDNDTYEDPKLPYYNKKKKSIIVYREFYDYR